MDKQELKEYLIENLIIIINKNRGWYGSPDSIEVILKLEDDTVSTSDTYI